MSDEEVFVESNARVGIFADTHSLFYQGRQTYQCKIDYKNLKTKISRDRDVIIAHAYLLVKDEDQSKSFESALKHGGYSVKIKQQQFREYSKSNPNNVGNVIEEEKISKNIISWEMGIAIDMIKWAPKLDVICLVSGNGVFEDVVKHIKESYGVSVEIAGFKQSTSSRLKDLADSFIDLAPKDANDLPNWLTPFKVQGQPVLA